MNFQEAKKKQLSKKDKSSIGSWDSKIKGLCEKINRQENYYTTSSCSGRVCLIKGLNEKASGVFLFKNHDKINFRDLKRELENVKYRGLVEFQMTCCILHVACKSLEDAQRLVDKAKYAGWKRSGIISTKKRFIVELISTEGMSFPIMSNGKVLVDNAFLKLVVKLVNEKLERVWEKIGKLERLI